MSTKQQEKSTWSDAKEIKKLQKKFGKSEQGNFSIIDTIPVPHPYMITPKHLEYNNSMYLGHEQIESMETKHGPLCGQRFTNGTKCQLKYADHKRALLVECKVDFKDTEGKANPELHKWLLAIKDLATKAKFEGFAFIEATGGNK